MEQAWDSDQDSNPDGTTCLHDLEHVISPLRTSVFIEINGMNLG